MGMCGEKGVGEVARAGGGYGVVERGERRRWLRLVRERERRARVGELPRGSEGVRRGSVVRLLKEAMYVCVMFIFLRQFPQSCCIVIVLLKLGH